MAWTNLRVAENPAGITGRHIRAPDCNGLRAAFQWETKRRADEAQPGKVRRGL